MLVRIMSSVSSTGAVGNIPLEAVIQHTDFVYKRYGSVPFRMNRVWIASITLGRHFEGESGCRL